LPSFFAIGPSEDDIFTIGHSVHELDELVALLRQHGVEALVDVRMYPRSRRVPQFNSDLLERSLPERGVAYHHARDLGGLRVPVAGSPNDGWREEGFRGYADHMATPEFAAAIERLGSLARGRATTVMCAEAAWRQCHRRLLSDALGARGWRVLHIGPDGALSEHERTEFAVVSGISVTYPAPQTALDI
jgi:uncharacterized protein (DUF488 family)